MSMWMQPPPQSFRFAGSGSESDARLREKLRRAFFMWWADIMAEQDVFIVPEHALRAEEPALITPEEKEALDAPGIPVEDHLLAASVMAHFVPFSNDLTAKILEFVGFVVTFESSTEEHRGGHNDMDEAYLELTVPNSAEMHLPRGVSLGTCIQLDAECCSHDQGWATFDREHNGTYSASYTWSEVAIAKVEAQEGTEDVQETELARQTLCCNLRARNYFRHHCKQFRDRGPDGILQHIAPGRKVALMLRSQYPGWTNTAKFGRLRAQMLLQIDEDFEFYSWERCKSMYSQRQHANDRFCCIQ